jgi:hypothetical protein
MFVGTVTSQDGVVTTMTVSSALRSVSTATVKLQGAGGGDCSFPFQIGGTYLVYASGTPPGLLFAHLCGATKPLHAAFADLVYASRRRGDRSGPISPECVIAQQGRR